MFPPGEQGQGAHLGPAGPRCPGTCLERAAARQKEGEPPHFLQEWSVFIEGCGFLSFQRWRAEGRGRRQRREQVNARERWKPV